MRTNGGNFLTPIPRASTIIMPVLRGLYGTGLKTVILSLWPSCRPWNRTRSHLEPLLRTAQGGAVMSAERAAPALLWSRNWTRGKSAPTSSNQIATQRRTSWWKRTQTGNATDVLYDWLSCGHSKPIYWKYDDVLWSMWWKPSTWRHVIYQDQCLKNRQYDVMSVWCHVIIQVQWIESWHCDGHVISQGECS